MVLTVNRLFLGTVVAVVTDVTDVAVVAADVAAVAVVAAAVGAAADTGTEEETKEGIEGGAADGIEGVVEGGMERGTHAAVTGPPVAVVAGAVDAGCPGVTFTPPPPIREIGADMGAEVSGEETEVGFTDMGGAEEVEEETAEDEAAAGAGYDGEKEELVAVPVSTSDF